MNRQDKQKYLEKHSDAIYCCQICAVPVYWWCGYKSTKHIFECRVFKPIKESKKGV